MEPFQDSRELITLRLVALPSVLSTCDLIRSRIRWLIADNKDRGQEPHHHHTIRHNIAIGHVSWTQP